MALRALWTELQTHNTEKLMQGASINGLCHEVGRILRPRDFRKTQASSSNNVLHPERLRVEVPDAPQAAPLRYANRRAGVNVEPCSNIDSKIRHHRL